MRGYGIPQAAFAAECMADDLAPAIHMDPLEFRMKNCMPEGYVDPHTHAVCNTYGLKECMEKGRELIHWDEKRKEYENQTGPVRKGIGMAIFCYKTGVYPISLETAACRMILNQDGSMQLQMGATEIGQGADTVFTQMAAETTGITEDRVQSFHPGYGYQHRLIRALTRPGRRMSAVWREEGRTHFQGQNSGLCGIHAG